MKFVIDKPCPFSRSPIPLSRLKLALPITVHVVGTPPNPDGGSCIEDKYRISRTAAKRIRRNLGLSPAIGYGFFVCAHMGHVVQR